MAKRVIIACALALPVLAIALLFWFKHPVPRIDRAAYKPRGDQIWSQIAAHHDKNGGWPKSEEELLSSGILDEESKKWFLETRENNRIFLYENTEEGPCLNMYFVPGFFSGYHSWKAEAPFYQKLKADENFREAHSPSFK
jgi:hypothetical protein